VFCDLDFLATLPRVDLVAGLAEVIKVGFTSDPVILDLIELDPAAATDPTSRLIGELIYRAISVKASVVASDLRESATTGIGREVLNYGHTFAHAVEQVEKYRWRHGDAVSVGIMFEAHLAHAAGLLSPDIVDRQRSILRSVGLPTSYSNAALDDLVEVMKVDKKSRGDLLRFVVLEGIGNPRILAGPSNEQLSIAYERVGKDDE
jgi:3-dehydroquinate synthase